MRMKYYSFSMYSPFTMVTAWGKLFPRAWLLEEPFTEGRLHEDESTTFRLYFRARHVALSSRAVWSRSAAAPCSA